MRGIILGLVMAGLSIGTYWFFNGQFPFSFVDWAGIGAIVVASIFLLD